jgi:hypothetical protein
VTPDQAIEIARQIKGVGPDIPAGIGTDGRVFVVSFDTGEEWNNLSVVVDPATGQGQILSADAYSRLLPHLTRL